MLFGEPIRNQMRTRIVNAGIIPVDDIQFENRPFEPGERRLWMAEFWGGGDDRIFTTRRNRFSTFIRYDVYVKDGTATYEAQRVIAEIKNEFSLNSPDKRRILVPTSPELFVYVSYQSGDGGEKETDTSWYRVPIILYLDITYPG